MAGAASNSGKLDSPAPSGQDPVCGGCGGGGNWAEALRHMCRSIAAISCEVGATPPSSHCACVVGVW